MSKIIITVDQLRTAIEATNKVKCPISFTVGKISKTEIEKLIHSIKLNKKV